MILDFAKEGKNVKNNFLENMNDLETFFRNLFLLKGRSLKGDHCVIIFDEVQLFRRRVRQSNILWRMADMNI